MLKKTFFVLLLFITCSCNKEGTFNDIPLDNGMVPESPKENVDFVRLVDNMTKTAGVLTFDGKGDEATLKWIVAEGCNLDTTQTTVPLTDGKGKLPICWDKMLKDSLYGPRDMAFKAGVMVVTKDGSQYFPLLWAYEVDSTKINAKAVQTRAGGVTPRASVIRFIPQTVAMNDVSGATMVVSYTGVNFVVLNYQDFTQSTNVNIDNLPGLVGTDGSTFTELKFRWRTTELPAVPFTAQVLAEADDGYKARGTVTWGADSPSLNISPLEQQLPAEGGEKVGGVSIVTNQFRWSAVTNQSWLSIVPTTGNGADMIYFSPDANPYTVIRTAIVTVTCFNASGNVTIRKTIEVTQDAASATTLAVVPTSHMIAGNGGTVVSNITSNTLWTAVSNASWLAVAPSSGSSNGNISLTASPNMGLTARTAMVTVTAGGKSQNITIIQTGGEQYTVYFRASEGGRVDKTSASGINGQSVFATATPNSGYKFVGWFNPNSQLLTKNVRLERKLTEITNGKTFEARFGEPELEWAPGNLGYTPSRGYYFQDVYATSGQQPVEPYPTFFRMGQLQPGGKGPIRVNYTPANDPCKQLGHGWMMPTRDMWRAAHSSVYKENGVYRANIKYGEKYYNVDFPIHGTVGAYGTWRAVNQVYDYAYYWAMGNFGTEQAVIAFQIGQTYSMIYNYKRLAEIDFSWVRAHIRCVRYKN